MSVVTKWSWREEDQVLVLKAETEHGFLHVNLGLEQLTEILVTLPAKMLHQALFALYNAISERDTILAQWKKL